MNPNQVLHYLLLVLTTLTSILALPSPSPAPPLSAETSLTSSIRSFESAWSHLDSQLAEAEEKRKAFATKEKWATRTGAGLSLLGTSGYIASSTISRAVNYRKKHLKEVQQALTPRKRGGLGGEGMRRRAFEELAKPIEEEGESFYSALSRSSSQRLEEFHEEDLQNQALEPSHEDLHPSSSVQKANSQIDQIQQNRDMEERLAAVESAILDIKRMQHEQTKMSGDSKAMLVLGLLNAVGGLVSAELSVQNAIEAAEGRH